MAGHSRHWVTDVVYFSYTGGYIYQWILSHHTFVHTVKCQQIAFGIPECAFVDAEFVSVYGLTANNAFGLIGNRILVYVQIVPDRIGHVSGSGTIILIRSTFCQCNGRNDPVVFEVIDNIFAGQFDQHFFFICPRETCGIEMRQFSCLFFFQYFVYGFPYGDDLLFSCFGIDNE